MMRLFRILKGEAFEICSFEQERENSVRKFLDDLEQHDKIEYRALMTRIRHIAQSGQPSNNRQMRALRGIHAEKLVEIKPILVLV